MKTATLQHSSRSVWMISFADLLTLLVGYLVLALSFKMQANQEVNKNPGLRRASGTVIADRLYQAESPNPLLAEVVVFDTQVSNQFIADLTSVKDPTVLKLAQYIELSACNSGRQTAGGILSGLLYQLDEVGVRREVYNYGDSCESLRVFSAPTEKPVATVKVIGFKNG